jgi:hypothetical protein
MNNGFVLKSSLIAPCGMNCGICAGYLRDKNKCPGCNETSVNKPRYCRKCIIKNCEQLKKNNLKYCFNCEKYPCKRLRQLDKRYRTKYSMSMIENLNNILEFGIREFIRNEKARWACSKCGGVVCVHNRTCIKCGNKREQVFL